MRPGKRVQPMLVAGAIGVLLSAGCGNGISGTFEDEAGVTRYEFEPGGRARVSVLGATVAAEYTRDGDRILVTSPQGTVFRKCARDRAATRTWRPGMRRSMTLISI